MYSFRIYFKDRWDIRLQLMQQSRIILVMQLRSITDQNVERSACDFGYLLGCCLQSIMNTGFRTKFGLLIAYLERSVIHDICINSMYIRASGRFESLELSARGAQESED